MKKIIIGIIVVMMSMGMGTAFADKPDDGTTGNGAPQVKKVFSLNIIGVPKDKVADMDDNNGHRIFVPLEGKAKIELTIGDEFAVLDANATEGSAIFQLPPPGFEAYVTEDNVEPVLSAYSVYVRPLGKPGGMATITTCADLIENPFSKLLSNREVNILNDLCFDGGYASVEQVAIEIPLPKDRSNGKSTFTNVTAELLSIVFHVEVLTSEGEVDYETHIRVPLFDENLYGEYWEYNNQGLKLLQVRFYDEETDVSIGDSEL
jgi:hypothetical protein